METFSHVPPGFRFHPTDEELVDYYLRKKIASQRIDLDVIKEVDLYKIEPWDLQELCKIGTDEQNDWFFFSHKDKKYPTGTRTNRATKAGFWKATGRDKAIYSKQHNLIGMRKTLVFYQGRAPNGQKSDWIMHEYRLETNENCTSQEEGWAVCKVFKKKMPATARKMGDQGSPFWYDDQVSFMPGLDSSCRHQQTTKPYTTTATSFLLEQQYLSCKQELELEQRSNMPQLDIFHQLPLLESPKESNELHHKTQKDNVLCSSTNNEQSEGDQLTDWRVLDKFVATQLSQEDGSGSFKESNYENSNSFQVDGTASSSYFASMSNTNCPIDDDMWK